MIEWERPSSLERILIRWVQVICGKCEVDSLFRGLVARGRVTSMLTVVIPLAVVGCRYGPADNKIKWAARRKGR
jgi:hypothetical protein